MAKVGTHLHIVEKFVEQTGAGNGETLKTNNGGKGYGVVYYNPNGAGRTGVILQAGVENGQIVRVVNTADTDEPITFAAAGTSFVAIGTSAVIEQNSAAVFIWSVLLNRWIPVTAPVAAA